MSKEDIAFRKLSMLEKLLEEKERTIKILMEK